MGVQRPSQKGNAPDPKTEGVCGGGIRTLVVTSTVLRPGPFDRSGTPFASRAVPGLDRSPPITGIHFYPAFAWRLRPRGN